MNQPASAHTLLVIDDHALIRKGVSQLLELEPKLKLAGEASSGAEGIALARTLRPDIILLDLNMREMNGLETLERLKAIDGLPSRIVVLTVSDNREDVLAAFQLGADGYLLKDMDHLELLDRLKAAGEGRLVVSPELAELLAEALRPNSVSPDQVTLTDRERQILILLGRGFSNKQVGRELGITESTVKVHMRNLLKKLDLRSRTEAAVWALKHGIGISDHANNAHATPRR